MNEKKLMTKKELIENMKSNYDLFQIFFIVGGICAYVSWMSSFKMIEPVIMMMSIAIMLLLNSKHCALSIRINHWRKK